MSRQWIYKLLKRYNIDGLPAVEPASRKPKSNPNQTPQNTIQRIADLRQTLGEQGLDNGATTIAWHLTREGIKPPAKSTIWRILKQAGLVTPQPKNETASLPATL